MQKLTFFPCLTDPAPLSAALTSPNRSDDPLSAALTSPYTVGSNPALRGVTDSSPLCAPPSSTSHPILSAFDCSSQNPTGLLANSRGAVSFDSVAGGLPVNWCLSWRCCFCRGGRPRPPVPLISLPREPGGGLPYKSFYRQFTVFPLVTNRSKRQTRIIYSLHSRR